MVTGMDSLVSQGRREELLREIQYGRPGRRRRTNRLAFWLPREISGSISTQPVPKIRRLQDAGVSTQA